MSVAVLTHPLSTLGRAVDVVRALLGGSSELTDDQERVLAAEYEQAMGMDLSMDKQVELLKQRSEGAPRVQRSSTAQQ